MGPPFVLSALGWAPFFAEAFSELAEPGWMPGRVNSAIRDVWRVLHRGGEVRASVSGRLRFSAESGEQLPVVGDWVAAEIQHDGGSVIHWVSPRLNYLSRRDAGMRAGLGEETGREQVIAANVDVALVVCGLDRDFSPRRIERYVTLAYSCGVQPVVALTKADLCPALPAREAETRSVAPGVDVGAVDSLAGAGVDWVRAQIPPGKTACLLGSSGAGKSTLINQLLGQDRLRTRVTSAVTGKGQHTTTHRQLFVLPGGGVVIDNPGLREIGLAGDEEAVADSFAEIDGLAETCRFRDCSHNNEPGCAVRSAVEAGDLPADRLNSYHRLRRELHYRTISQEMGAAAAERKKWQPIRKSIREMKKR